MCYGAQTLDLVVPGHGLFDAVDSLRRLVKPHRNSPRLIGFPLTAKA